MQLTDRRTALDRRNQIQIDTRLDRPEAFELTQTDRLTDRIRDDRWLIDIPEKGRGEGWQGQEWFLLQTQYQFVDPNPRIPDADYIQDNRSEETDLPKFRKQQRDLLTFQNERIQLCVSKANLDQTQRPTPLSTPKPKGLFSLDYIMATRAIEEGGGSVASPGPFGDFKSRNSFTFINYSIIQFRRQQNPMDPGTKSGSTQLLILSYQVPPNLLIQPRL